MSSASCYSCHPAAGDALVMYGGNTFDHRKHSTANKCESCHSTSQETHGRLVMTKNDCNSCHHQTVAKGNAKCESCHTTQAAVFNGKIPEFASAQPSFKVDLDFACTDCHETRGASVSRNVAPVCVGCHDASFADTLHGWQNNAAQLSKTVHEALSSYKPGSEKYKQYSQLADLLQKDGSGSAHNPSLFKRWFESIGAAQ